MLLILKNKKAPSQKTTVFLKLLKGHLEKTSVPFFISSFEEVQIYIETGSVRILVSGRSLEDFSTVFPRKVGNYSGTAYIIAREIKKRRNIFIDSFRLQTNDLTKLIQMYLFSSLNIKIPKTYYAPFYTEENLLNAIQYLNFPIIIKQCNTSKGSGVAMAHDTKELAEKIGIFEKFSPEKEILLQEFIPNTFEYRILVTGNAVAVAERKVRMNEDEFRNNVHLGAREEFMRLEGIKPTIIKTALLAAKATDIQIAGVDIVETEDGIPLVFEVNSCPAFTLDEKISNEMEKLSEYLALCEKR